MHQRTKFFKFHLKSGRKDHKFRQIWRENCIQEPRATHYGSFCGNTRLLLSFRACIRRRRAGSHRREADDGDDDDGDYDERSTCIVLVCQSRESARRTGSVLRGQMHCAPWASQANRSPGRQAPPCASWRRRPG